MKKIITLLGITLITMSCFAQKSDTLKVDISKYHFIKIGDKVYKIVSTLEEVKPIIQVDSIGIFQNPWGGTMQGLHGIIMPVTGTVPMYNYLPGTQTAPYSIPNTNDGVYHPNEFNEGTK